MSFTIVIRISRRAQFALARQEREAKSNGSMERPTAVHCVQCRQPIISGEGFVCFKTPGKETYQFFHYRVRVGDCWEGHLAERR